MRDLASEIYKRDYSLLLKRDVVRRSAVNALLRRQEELADASDGFKWYGHAVSEGLPLPGNFSGLAGTLGQEEIRVSNAFMTGFLWFLILLVLVVAATVAFKWAVEGFTEALSHELKPGTELVDDDELEADLRERVQLLYHPSGTCRMSDTHPEAVVDSALRVHGLLGLRVVDASVMPTVSGGNTHAPTVMIAERAADLISGATAVPEAAAVA